MALSSHDRNRYETFLTRLRERAEAFEGSPCPVVSSLVCRSLAAELGIAYRAGEIFALSHGICPSRYERNMGTIGLDGQIKLLESTVAVVGLGGLGGFVVEMLARAGMGCLVLVDGDCFSEGNLNRQLLCLESNLGRGKAESAKERVLAIDSALDVRTFTCYIDEENAPLCLGGIDVAIDALDNNAARSVVYEFCRKSGIPFVHGAIGGMWAQVGVFGPDDHAPWELFPDAPDRGVELLTGNPPFTPAFAAALETSLAIRVLCRPEEVKTGVLDWCDMKEMNMRRLELS